MNELEPVTAQEAVLDMDATNLRRHPAEPSSIDALLRDQPREVIDLAMKLIAAITNVPRPEQHPDERSPPNNLVSQSLADEVERIPTKELAPPAPQRPLIPERLRLLRRAAGYKTQAAFARGLGISPQRYCNSESDYPLSLDVAHLIVALVPGCTLDWLYYGIEAELTVDLLQRLRHSQKP